MIYMYLHKFNNMYHLETTFFIVCYTLAKRIWNISEIHLQIYWQVLLIDSQIEVVYYHVPAAARFTDIGFWNCQALSLHLQEGSRAPNIAECGFKKINSFIWFPLFLSAVFHHWSKGCCSIYKNAIKGLSTS